MEKCNWCGRLMPKGGYAMKKIPMLLLAFFASSLCFAGGSDLTEGVFGKRLGETFDVSTATSISSNQSALTYIYQPSMSNAFFKIYSVEVTPISHRIYSIQAKSPSQ
jgi:hypothetical protein